MRNVKYPMILVLEMYLTTNFALQMQLQRSIKVILILSTANSTLPAQERMGGVPPHTHPLFGYCPVHTLMFNCDLSQALN